MSLDDRQVDLFSRQVLLREVGGRGQERLLASRVLVAGRGPAAESAATYLVGAGVGTVGVSGAGALEEIGFAPLAERSVEVSLVEVDPEGGIDLGEWDVSVETGRDLVARGRARRG
ncbi:MAG: ThiF family adenylyltransferase, partial [Alphaproteobacteria bacterium]